MFEELDALTAHARQQDGWGVLDVRTPQEFAQGRPAGSVNVPILFMGAMGMHPNQEFLVQVQQHFGTDARLLVTCKSGGRSARACQILAQAGYPVLANVSGGWSGGRAVDGTLVQGWLDAGLPIEP